MLQLTKEATRHLVKARTERGVDDTAGARFVSKDGRLGLTFASAPSPGDVIVEGEGIKVCVASDISATLDMSIIDAREIDGKRALLIRKQPAAEASSRPN